MIHGIFTLIKSVDGGDNTETDIVALDKEGNHIIFGGCIFRKYCDEEYEV